MNKGIVSLLMLCCLMISVNVSAEPSIGVIKTLKGDVSVLRDSELTAAALGEELFAADTLQTSSNGAVGILLHDDARLSLGPDSTMSLDQFNFDPKNHEGQANVSVKQGTLSVISGKLTEKRPGALQVKTPAAILAVRGTEFSVKVDPRP